MAPDLNKPPDSCSPAAYGQACAGCSRAKHKCFYRSEGSQCERCHRLGKPCEPSRAVRKRKAPTPVEAPYKPPPPPSSTRIEQKIDDLVSLVRSQNVQMQAQTAHHTPHSTPESNSMAPTIWGGYDGPVSSVQDPDVVIDPESSAVRLLRPISLPASSPILDDVSSYSISHGTAEERLDTFRRAFISMFPFVHIPATTTESELRRQKPFLWFIIMALTTKMVSEQFQMEKTIWHVISQRIVCEQHANIDLLLGLICFTSWSFYFKKDKPYMTMVTQLAVSLAAELRLQSEVSTAVARRSRADRVLAQEAPQQRTRTMEERRTMLAVYHLTGCTWAAEKLTEPIRWTPYMESSLRLINEGTETEMDIVLATQIKCQIVANQVISFTGDTAVDGDGPETPSAAFITALLGQLNHIRQTIPAHIASQTVTQLFLCSAELVVRETFLRRPKIQDETGLSNFRRLEHLDAVLTAVEQWMAVFRKLRLVDWVGVNAHSFTQFTNCLVVLFKLTTLDEPGWDLYEVRRRADLFEILDQSCELMDAVPVALGIVDADGPRRGLFFKASRLCRGIKALFLAEIAPETPPGALLSPDSGSYSTSADFSGASVSDDFVLSLAGEPWLTDLWDPSWNFMPESSQYMSFDS